jgi:hypothetical protein
LLERNGIDTSHIALGGVAAFALLKGWWKQLREKGAKLLGSMTGSHKTVQETITESIVHIRAAMEREAKSATQPGDAAIAKVLTDAIRPTSSPAAPAVPAV